MPVKINLSLHELKLSSDIVKLIGEIDEFKGAWKAYGNLAPQRLVALKRVATIESVASSTRIEGNTLTDEEVASVLDGLSQQSFRSRDEQEVAGYGSLMNLIFSSWEQMPVSENIIRQMHKELMRYSDKDASHRGEYKKVENRVAAFRDGKMIGMIFETASAYETPFLMTELVDWYGMKCDENEHHPLVLIAVFIAVFLLIHPFEDGNGRLSRALTTLMLLKSGYAYTPYGSLESVVESTKQTYYAALRLTQKTITTESANWDPWILYFLRSLRQQIWQLEGRLSQEHLLRSVPELSLSILELVRARGQVKMDEIARVTRSPRATIVRHIKGLLAEGYLIRGGTGRGTFYCLGGTGVPTAK